MKVLVSKKIQTTILTNGKRFSTDVEVIDNVSSISESDGNYVITPTAGTSASFSTAEYLISIIPK